MCTSFAAQSLRPAAPAALAHSAPLPTLSAAGRPRGSAASDGFPWGSPLCQVRRFCALCPLLAQTAASFRSRLSFGFPSMSGLIENIRMAEVAMAGITLKENIPAEILEYAFSSKQKDAIIEMTQIFDLLCERTCQSYDETH